MLWFKGLSLSYLTKFTVSYWTEAHRLQKQLTRVFEFGIGTSFTEFFTLKHPGVLSKFFRCNDSISSTFFVPLNHFRAPLLSSNEYFEVAICLGLRQTIKVDRRMLTLQQIVKIINDFIVSAISKISVKY